MKYSAKYLVLTSIGLFFLSSCTMGDKGSGKVPDSVKIDTSRKAQPVQKTSDTTLIDSLQTDTAKGKKP